MIVHLEAGTHLSLRSWPDVVNYLASVPILYSHFNFAEALFPFLLQVPVFDLTLNLPTLHACLRKIYISYN